MKGKSEVLLRFDFAIFDNTNLSYLIEFDGIQHFEQAGSGWGKENLKEIKKRDQLKNKYCNKHNIILKRIPYKDLEKITYKDIISNKYNIPNPKNKKDLKEYYENGLGYFEQHHIGKEITD